MASILEGLGAELISSLTGGARTALPYIVHGVLSGLSANLIGNALTQAGLGVRRSALLTIVRSIRSTVEGAEYQRGLQPDILPAPQLFQGAQTFMRRPFAYVVKVTGTNIKTGAPATQYITISTSDVLSNESIAEYVSDIIDEGVDTYALEMDDFEITQVLTDPRFLP